MISAPSSGAGKTTITLGVLRALQRRGVAVQPAKSGPDYIDPKFHNFAYDAPSVNLDAWAMSPPQIAALAGAGGLVVEGAMGLFDGAGLAGTGSSAELAKQLNLPVVLIVDAAKTAHSVAALVHGFCTFDPNITIAGIILNRVGSARHADMIKSALTPHGIPILGCVYRNADLTIPERHLGLVQASEISGLNAWIDRVADILEVQVDLDALQNLTGSIAPAPTYTAFPPAQRIAIAKDIAFEFAYPHMLQCWSNAGAELTFFSPLADEVVPKEVDYVFLPGGYPELHAGRLASARKFMTSLRQHAEIKPVYGECGGYMTLGDGLVDAQGVRHEMAGLLRLETSFAKRKLHLGYRKLAPLSGQFQGPLMAHEFHYASTQRADGPALFSATDADGGKLSDMGLRLGHVCGSFAHIISGF